MTDTLFEEYKADIPDPYHETFDRIVGQGKSPSVVVAAITYVTTPQTRPDIAAEYDVSVQAIDATRDAVLEIGPRDIEAGKLTKADYCRRIAEQLGWEEGQEYRIKEDPDGGYYAMVHKQGWQELYAIIDSLEDGDNG